MNEIETKLCDEIKTAFLEKTPLEILGNETKSDIIGRKITGKPLHIKKLTGIVSYDPAELVLTVKAGTLIQEINEVLNKNNQYLSFEPPTFNGKATIGGTLAANLSGPARPWSGSIRDMTLGVKIINGRGELLRFGGQVMKNVAGYDLSRFQAGALGTLGVLTEISLKVLPKPEKHITMTMPISQADALKKINEISGTTLPISGAVWYQDVLYCRFSGYFEISHLTKVMNGTLLEDSEQFWIQVAEHTHSFFKNADKLWKISVSNATYLNPTSNQSFIDWGGATRWIANSEENEIEKIANNLNGHYLLYKGGDRQSEVRQKLPIILQNIHKKLKLAMDPTGIMNPGKLYGWL